MRKAKDTVIWCADCETNPFDGESEIKPFIWGITNGDDYYEFTDTNEFLDFAVQQDGIIYAHNGGKFDWFFILHRLEQFTPVMVINGRLAKFTIGAAEFRDSYNILPVPLSAYQKDEIDYAIFTEEERHKPENWAAIREYLKSDCFYLHEFVTRFVSDYGLNLTVASTALKQWSKISGMKTPETTKEFYNTFSKYYYGGRVEPFKTGCGDLNFKVIDINSAYPFAMMSYHPWGDSYDQRLDLPNTDSAISRCFISLRCRSRGAFPYRSKNGLGFPNDNQIREFYVTGWEYLAARDTDSLHGCEILSVTQFKESIEFSDYVNHFYKLKEESKGVDEAAYQFAKLFMNSLYGKWAANPEEYSEYEIVPQSFIAAAMYCKGCHAPNMYECDCGNYNGMNFNCNLGDHFALMEKPLSESKQRYYNVATAASITGFVRAYLWRALCKCDKVLYCDTDSIAAVGFDGIDLDPLRLGAWDIEAECNYYAIGGKKMYAFRKKPDTFDPKKEKEWKIASKGVRLTPDELIQVAKGETVKYSPLAPSFSISNGVDYHPRKVKKLVVIDE